MTDGADKVMRQGWEAGAEAMRWAIMVELMGRGAPRLAASLTDIPVPSIEQVRAEIATLKARSGRLLL